MPGEIRKFFGAAIIGCAATLGAEVGAAYYMDERVGDYGWFARAVDAIPFVDYKPSTDFSLQIDDHVESGDYIAGGIGAASLAAIGSLLYKS